jgi:hypothetical protein
VKRYREGSLGAWLFEEQVLSWPAAGAILAAALYLLLRAAH